MPINLTDPLISLLVQVPIGVATLIVFVVYMRQNAQTQKEAAQERKEALAAAAEDRKQMLLLISQGSQRFEKVGEVVAHQTEVIQGSMAFNKSLVDAVVHTAEDTTAAIATHAKHTIDELNKGRAAIIHDVDENLGFAVTRSVDNQNRIQRELKGVIELSETNIIQRLDSVSGAIAGRLDKFSKQLEQVPGMNQHSELLTELSAIKSSVARIEAAQTRPLPTLPTLSLSTEPGVSAPPSLVLTHGDSKGDLTPVVNPPFAMPSDGEVKG